MSGEREKIRPQYEAHGVAGFYEQFGATYSNPHEPQIKMLLEKLIPDWSLDLSSVLDLACGSGEVSSVILNHGGQVTGIDPFTFEAYQKRTGLEAEQFSFEDIANGVLENRRFSLIVCSFALHLVEASRLPTVAFQLAQIANTLLILTPHKRPNLKAEWGWSLESELLETRVRARLYRTSNAVRLYRTANPVRLYRTANPVRLYRKA
jgi:SAM-dependent methyltransferase